MKNIIIKDTMREILLPPALLVKGLIKGNAELIYENYLIEFLNNSCYFLKRSNGIEYCKPISENLGECDCYAHDYGIDFKLIASNSELHARSQLSDQIHYLQPGVSCVCSSEKDRTMTVTYLHKLLRFWDFERQVYIGEGDGHTDIYEKDVKNYIKLLSTKKNLLLFHPYTFLFDEECNFNYAVSIIRQALEEDFVKSLEYRSSKQPMLETYLSFVYDDFFIILKYVDGHLKLLIM